MYFKTSCNAITKLMYSKQYNDFVPRRTHMLPVAAVTGRTTGLQTTTLGISMVVLVRATPAKVRHGYCVTKSDRRGFKDFFENMETKLCTTEFKNILIQLFFWVVFRGLGNMKQRG